MLAALIRPTCTDLGFLKLAHTSPEIDIKRAITTSEPARNSVK